MAWNQLSMSPGEKLTRIKNWEKRGLAYWEQRIIHCEERVRDADEFGVLRRANADLQIAREAVRRLNDPALGYLHAKD